MNLHRVINSSIDCISLFKANKYLLKNMAVDIIKARKLNRDERVYFLDLIFAWARESCLVRDFLKYDLRFYTGMSCQQQDILIINILAKTEQYQELHDRYEKYLDSLGEGRYLRALG